MNRLALVTLLLGLVPVLPAGAASTAPPPRPDDFALGITIDADPALPYFDVDLGERVYRTATDPALRDVRFFDAAGEVLRHQAIDAATDSADTPVEGTTALPIFPLSHAALAEVRAVTEIRIGNDGHLATITARRDAHHDELIHAYLVDASAVADSARRFEIDLAAPFDGIAAYTIEGSDDLDRWTTLVARASLVNLAHEGRQVSHTRFELDADARHPYLRLRWRDPATAPRITGVRARHAARVSAAPLAIASVAGHATSGDAGAIEFDAGGYFPVARVGLVLTPNRVVRGTLDARRAVDAPWQHVHDGDWYALRVDDLTVRSTACAALRTGFRYWRFTPATGESLAPDAATLELHWRAGRYRVLATGDGPYLLAVGSARAAALPPPAAMPEVALDADTLARLSAPAVLGAARELGGESRRRPLAPALPWQRIALWAVLVAGVLMIGAMAWRLYGEMRRG